MRTRSTSLPIDGSIAPSREFPDKSLQEYPKRKPLATKEEKLRCATSAHTTATVGPDVQHAGTRSKQHQKWVPGKE